MGLGLLFPVASAASENWVIESFDTLINVQPSGKVAVIETVVVDFGAQEKHGIFRDLPTVYQNEAGEKHYTQVEVLELERNGAKEKYELINLDNYLRIKIGEADKTISGEQTYKIEYLASGVLTSLADYDELYWNITGNGWPVLIEAVSATVNLPSSEVLQAACYEGVEGSSIPCISEKRELSASFKSTRLLTEGEGLTIAVGYTKGLVPIINVPKPLSIWDKLFKPESILTFIITLAVGTGLVIWFWYQKGRDFWIARRFLGDPKTREAVRPIGGHETVVVEFVPPDNLRPAEIGALLDERADTMDVTATLVDLANRGFLEIKEEPKKWVFGATDYVLTNKLRDQQGLLDYEKELLDRLFDEADSVKLSALKNKFYKDLVKVKEKLYQNVVDKKFFLENPRSVRLKYSLISIGLVVVGAALGWVGFQASGALLVALGGGVVLPGILAIILAQSMPARTALGRELYVRVSGYRLFIEKAEKYRQQFFEKKNLFNEVLPYAIMFGMTAKLAKAFEKMGLEPQQPSWYTGAGAFNAYVFGQSMSGFSNSFSKAIASTPSSSGSGGGGSSGGGFGGGGGGSW
ncbi:MAG TPA: DUF2207 domain-containing protein [Candidatus Nanoarchaeia archaeon]|nr:hypothetical protein [uncultured archaeon]